MSCVREYRIAGEISSLQFLAPVDCSLELQEQTWSRRQEVLSGQLPFLVGCALAPHEACLCSSDEPWARVGIEEAEKSCLTHSYPAINNRKTKTGREARRKESREAGRQGG
ncbi:hypothetical protein E2C01_053460 [Portunus trituberculatus]|uniref:Uncharacterized protein n=1 Tax=Portunus trituberculatus TaxID=210409 RepID=A0A5B7GH63_PORTR|nr:hypothetical protein [Portunus trituberculatus]